jgi:hypothetical protein
MINLDATQDELKSGVAYISAAARGLIGGYVEGMYKNKNYVPQAKCFDAETQGYIVDFATIWTPKASDTTWGTAIVSLQKAMLMISDWCDFDESIYGYLTFCYDSETDQCSVTYMIGAVMKKIFQLTQVGTDLVQAISDGGFPTKKDTADVITAFFRRIAVNGGKVLRYATDFDPVKYPLTN